MILNLKIEHWYLFGVVTYHTDLISPAIFLAWAVHAGALHNNNSQSQNVFITLHDLWLRIYATDQ